MVHRTNRKQEAERVGGIHKGVGADTQVTDVRSTA
jgi:hypothetical protein